LLGILTAGAAYLPLDPTYPKERLAFMVSDSGASVILLQESLSELLPESGAQLVFMDRDWDAIGREVEKIGECGVRAENLAYVIYTSGSTGKPKGVMIEHRNVVNFFVGMDACIKHEQGDTWLAVTTLSFDISVLEILWTLARGFKVVIFPGDQREQLEQGEVAIPALMQRHRVTHFQCTPTMASILMMDGACRRAFGPLKTLLIGGEPFPESLAQQLQGIVGGEVINMYGPTETTVWSTTYPVNNSKEGVLIGRPIANTQIHILDHHLQPVPIGVDGEILIGGAGVVRGYLNRPELTAERFIKNPFAKGPNSRLYRTGDSARFLPDGNIKFIGRMDHQVKIRGYRIELGEIEALLSAYPEVNDAVVIAREEVPGDKKLVAYVTPRNGERLSWKRLRGYLREKLPDYMVPAHLVTLDSFPQTPNKKIDRRALPAPEENRLESEVKIDPPQTELEAALAAIWAEALSVQQVGRNDNFFELGGDSLSACRMTFSIQQTCNIKLPLQTIFHSQTVAALAEKLEEIFLKQLEPKGTSPSGASAKFSGSEASVKCGRSPEEGGDSGESFDPPRTPIEETLAGIWAKTLGIERIGRNDNFFTLGGKSLQAVTVCLEIEKELGRKLPISILLEAGTVRQLADVLSDEEWQPNWSPLVPINPDGNKLPFFCVHAHRGNVLCYHDLARYLGADQPIYGLQARGLNGERISFRSFEQMAADYLDAIRAVQPRGPYLLGGFCLGGYIALEMGRILKAEAKRVALVALIETAHPTYPTYLSKVTLFHRIVYKMLERIEFDMNKIRAPDTQGTLNYVWERVKALATLTKVATEKAIQQPLNRLRVDIPHSRDYALSVLHDIHTRAYLEYHPSPYNGKVVIFRASRQPRGIQPDPRLGWGDLIKGELDLREIPGHYIDIFVEPSVRYLGEQLGDCLNHNGA
jgi:amino acid adenylation domain-containing protein